MVEKQGIAKQIKLLRINLQEIEVKEKNIWEKRGFLEGCLNKKRIGFCLIICILKS